MDPRKIERLFLVTSVRAIGNDVNKRIVFISRQEEITFFGGKTMVVPITNLQEGGSALTALSEICMVGRKVERAVIVVPPDMSFPMAQAIDHTCWEDCSLVARHGGVIAFERGTFVCAIAPFYQKEDLSRRSTSNFDR